MSVPDEKNPGREAILEALDRHGVEYVVIGGAAAQVSVSIGTSSDT